MQRSLADSAAALVSPAQAWEAPSWQLAFLKEHVPLFQHRIESGAIRDGHGDLRLEHVFFPATGKIEIIDGIEFDDRYRCADVCADVAFLAMDRARSGRVVLAERYLAQYARAATRCRCSTRTRSRW
jgi:aminoglycoside phosphotransferase family enzyme